MPQFDTTIRPTFHPCFMFISLFVLSLPSDCSTLFHSVCINVDFRLVLGLKRRTIPSKTGGFWIGTGSMHYEADGVGIYIIRLLEYFESVKIFQSEAYLHWIKNMNTKVRLYIVTSHMVML